jgi:hypothetical protein
MAFNSAADSPDGVGSYRNLFTLRIQTEIGTFLGVTSDQAFNRIVFSHDGCCSRSFAFDDVSFSTSLAADSPPSNGVPDACHAGLGDGQSSGFGGSASPLPASATWDVRLPNRPHR